jgi:hypothetical protein
MEVGEVSSTLDADGSYRCHLQPTSSSGLQTQIDEGRFSGFSTGSAFWPEETFDR